MKRPFLPLIILSAIIFKGCTQTSDNIVSLPDPLHYQAPDSIPNTLDYYGIDTSKYKRIEGRIRRNQFLSEILEKYGIGYPEIEQLINNSGDLFDVRKIKAGNRYTLYISSDSIRPLDYMVYEEDIINHFVLDFRDEPVVRKMERPSRLVLKYSSGTIETSLWNSIIDNDLHPALVDSISGIYAWSIDFFGLQEGDSFKVIYEEEYVDTISNGIHSIIAAFFIHSGSGFYAIPLIQEGKKSYYDLEGNSLRKEFLKAPLKYSRISSRYSNSRMHPVLRIRRPHHGVDYAAPVGTPVHTVGDGRIIMMEYQNGSGRIIKIRHNSVYTTAYMHLRAFGKGLSTGKYVKQGDIIGYVGSSGLSTGPHLDFRFYKNGYAVDPLKVKAPPVKPVSEDNIDKFNNIKSVSIQLLDSFQL